MLKLLKTICSPETFLFCAGDTDQSIYGWNGISENNVQNAITSLKLKLYHLTKSYRLPSQIVEPVNKLLSFNKNSLRENLVPANKIDGFIGTNQFRSEKDEKAFICRKVHSLCKNGHHPKIAILSRTNKICEEFNDLRDVATVSTVHKAKGLEFEYVFIVGAEDGIFPMIPDKVSLPPKEYDTKLREERRLFAEAMTRSSKKVYITAIINGCRGKHKGDLSQFLTEAELLK